MNIVIKTKILLWFDLRKMPCLMLLRVVSIWTELNNGKRCEQTLAKTCFKKIRAIVFVLSNSRFVAWTMTITAPSISANKIWELNTSVGMKSTRAGFRRNRINYSCEIIKQSCRLRTSNELTRNDQQRQSKFTSRRRVNITRSHLPLISPLGGIPSSDERTFSISSPHAEPSQATRREATSNGKDFCMPPVVIPLLRG